MLPSEPCVRPRDDQQRPRKRFNGSEERRRRDPLRDQTKAHMLAEFNAEPAFHHVGRRRGNDDGCSKQTVLPLVTAAFWLVHAIVCQSAMINGPADLLGLLDVRKRTLPHHRQRLCARRRWLRDN